MYNLNQKLIYNKIHEVRNMNVNENKKEPIYEKLAPGEVLIISKDENGGLEVAENVGGKVNIKKICPVKG